MDSEAVSEMERLQLEEAIQLSLALEESKKADQRLAFQEYEERKFNTDAFGVCLSFPVLQSCALGQAFYRLE